MTFTRLLSSPLFPSPGLVVHVITLPQVGGAVVEAFGARDCIGTYCATPVGGMVPFDMGAAASDPDLADELMMMVRPTLVCVCAGFTWVDGCENDKERADRMNASGPAAVAAAARRAGAKVVWYSTDYVFDGKAGPYAESDASAPLNVYGASKLAGEAAVLAADPAALVIRTNVVYGPEAVGKNFAYQLVRKLKAKESMSVPDDQVMARDRCDSAAARRRRAPSEERTPQRVSPPPWPGQHADLQR